MEWEARKYDASQRVVPAVAPLLAMLKRAYLEQGRPSGKERVCPARGSEPVRAAGLGVARCARRKTWKKAKLDSDHTPGVAAHGCHLAGRRWRSSEVASVLMGHATPARQPGAAPITLARYTHTLPQDVERARELLNLYLAERQATKVGGK